MISAWLAGEWAAGVRGGLALLAAWAFALLPRVPAAVTCWAWRAAYGVLIVSFLWTAPVDVPVLHDRAVVPPTITLPVKPASEVLRRPGSPARPIRVFGVPQTPASRAFHVHPAPLQTIAFAGWLTFAALHVGRLLWDWTRAHRLRSGRTMDVPDLADLCRAMGVRQPAVRTHPATPGPLLVGLWRPTVVLPDPPPAEVRLILAHELAHLRRRDLLWNWLPTVALALLPWHPLVWIGNRRWRLAVESACDADAVAATSATVAAYGRVLVSVATAPPPAGVLAVAAAAESRWLLKRRLVAMAHITRWNRRRLAAAGLIVGVFGTAAAVPWRAVA